MTKSMFIAVRLLDMDWKRRAALQKKEDALRSAEGFEAKGTSTPGDLLPFTLRKPEGEFKEVSLQDIMSMLQPILDRHTAEKKGIKFRPTKAERDEEKIEWRSHRKGINVNALFSPPTASADGKS